MDFNAFPKIPRLFRDYIITEKIDGTNAQIYISEDCSPITLKSGRVVPFLCGSRNRWIFPENDNYGFAAWAYNNVDELLKLGPGSHFGEWWGVGIQRRYGLSEKRFSPFNVSKWHQAGATVYGPKTEPAPSCCHVVPIVSAGSKFSTAVVEESIDRLIAYGSFAAPGFMQPEGVVVYHTAAGKLFKVTCEKDSVPKGVAE